MVGGGLVVVGGGSVLVGGAKVGGGGVLATEQVTDQGRDQDGRRLGIVPHQRAFSANER